MIIAAKSAAVEFRIALIDPRSRKVLALRTGDQYRLIHLSISYRVRWARQIQWQLAHDWGISAGVLEFLPLNDSHPRCVVAELLTVDFPASLHPANIDQLGAAELSEREREDLSLLLRDGLDSQVSRIGWLDSALAWAGETTGLACAKASIVQFNAGRGFALIQVPTQSGRVLWLKATSFPNEHEPMLTKALSSICPEAIPTWIGEKREWNAWLTEDGNSFVPDLSTPRAVFECLGRAVRCLAKLQSQTVERESLLLQAGAFDQGVGVLRAQADPLFSVITRAMGASGSPQEARIENRRLDQLRHIFETACLSVGRLGIPPTIVHGDMNLSNLLFGNDRCRFLDWSEGYLGFPLATLQHILLLNPIRDSGQKAQINKKLIAVYREAVEGFPVEALEQALVWMPLLAAASTLYGRGEWLKLGQEDTRRHSFIRTIARHMDVAVRQMDFHRPAVA